MLRLLRALRRDDQGAALVTVVALAAISIVVVTAIGTSLVAASSITVTSRSSVQSKASAEAGIEWALGEFNRGYFPCQGDQRSSDPAFLVTITYVSATGTTLSCSTSASGSPATATIDSTGYAAIGSNTHRIGAKATITLATSGALLDQAVFTESSLVLTNDSLVQGSAPGVLDGDVYTNGNLTCMTQNRIEGEMIARGNITIENTCQALDSLWAGGNVDLRQSDVRIAGDVYAAGSAAINKARILGNVVANGDVSTTNKSNSNCGSGSSTNVCGSVWSLNGAINLASNGSPIAGSLYARNGVTLPNNDETPRPAGVVSLNGGLTMLGSKVTGQVSVYGSISSSNAQNNINKSNTCSQTVDSTYWTKCTAPSVLPMVSNPRASFTPSGSTNLGTRAQVVSVNKPPRQGFPQILSTSTAIAQHWSGWVKPVVPADACASGNAMQTELTKIIGNYSSGTKLLLQMPCTDKLPGNNLSLTLKGDLAIMAPRGVNWENDTRISSSGGPWTFMVIAPSDSPGVTWSQPDPTGAPGQLSPTCSGGPTLYFQKLLVSNSTRIFLYTPCLVQIKNKQDSMDGQIYSGSGSYDSGLLIKRAIMTVPGVEIPGQTSGSSSTSAVITSRYDIG
ncbi:putative acyltransferase (DUF342 family)/Flp pilus assembly pilin Flp [Microbacteriaceae bacterium SG_E_30_P1]|uniref:Acyltransferase (DUF342 family)/Flp pilus assembly pilin Flp n=1 Tax=Antiquaquibacter oligotrophicus TaxID=2880260 RepID=A0ABT6KIW8_9MICO|nr:hypothetical protein [Antiquaquibacter oligotrophicus]MDH6179895.1 putative acyltransferase (DUF342 family)/Flp pilus assembly pilin Flp [Antiquaquibacter oligotrophicus]UDF14344.1 hypothetical protein LH407_05640 [Antiquaquibacter oligotrophicus]